MLARTAKNQDADELATSIADQLVAAKARLSDALRKQSEAAEASVTSGAMAAYEAAIVDVTKANAEITRLERAAEVVAAKVAEAARQRQFAENAALCGRVSKVLEQRLQVAKEFSEHVAALVRSWQKLITLSTKAHTAFPRPNGVEIPGFINAAALGNIELIVLASAELFRLGHVVPITGRPPSGRQVPSLPGPKSPGLQFLEQPEKVKPLTVAIQEANDYARATMEGKDPHG